LIFLSSSHYQTLITTTLDGAQMFAAIGRQRKSVTTTRSVLIIVQKLLVVAAHAQKVPRSVDKVRLFFFIVLQMKIVDFISFLLYLSFLLLIIRS
jgi:hypothetical protein